MGVNKVIFGNVTLIDTSDVTVTPEKMFEGETALGADGEIKTGTFTIDSELTEQDSLISQIQTALQGKAAAAESGSSGGSVETCQVKIVQGTPMFAAKVYYVDGDGNASTTTSTGTITVLKNTLLVTHNAEQCIANDGASNVAILNTGIYVVFVEGDGSLTM